MERVLQFLTNHFDPFPVLGEIMRIFPDALLWGAGFLAFVTSSFPFAIFFLTLLESLGLYFGIRQFNTWLGVITERNTKNSFEQKCKTGFTSVTLNSLSMFGSDHLLAFPSAPIYIMSVAISYTLSMLMTFKNELETLGTSYASRLYMSAIGLSSMLFLLMAYRSIRGCDSFTVIILSAVLGLAIGAILLKQNKLILGNSGINMLGIPLLYNSTASGNPLYVCNMGS
jgi:hypothetical protein